MLILLHVLRPDARHVDASWLPLCTILRHGFRNAPYENSPHRHDARHSKPFNQLIILLLVINILAILFVFIVDDGFRRQQSLANARIIS